MPRNMNTRPTGLVTGSVGAVSVGGSVGAGRVFVLGAAVEPEVLVGVGVGDSGVGVEVGVLDASGVGVTDGVGS